MARTLVLAALLPCALAYGSNCFKLLKEPLKDAPFSPVDMTKLLEHFRRNLDINGTGAVIASPGETPALPASCVGGYRYHWTRDGALSLAALLHWGEAFGVLDHEMEALFLRYATWVQGVHDQSAEESAFLEPKWQIDKALPYALGWCRPQSDGPPLRASTLIRAANKWPQHAGRFWKLARQDLDWLTSMQSNASIKATNIELLTCDLWEETTDTNFFWNKAVMRLALLEGVEYAVKVGDFRRGETYLHAVRTHFDPKLRSHTAWSLFGDYLAECPPQSSSESCRTYRKRIDGAVILGLIHGRPKDATPSSGSKWAPDAISVLVANTVKAYNKQFCSLYALNREDSAAGVPGVLFGRYAMDKYGTEEKGNPWPLISAALASLMYQAAIEVDSGRSLNAQELRAWQAALNADSYTFTGSVSDFVAAGDSILTRIRKHISDEDGMHVYEQIDRNTGKQYNAKDLTWSYAEILTALALRRTVTSEASKTLELHV